MKKTKILCDNNKCKKSVEFEVGDSYPYYKGWIYLYKHEFKVDQSQKQFGDKHFCSPECFVEFIKNLLEDALNDSD